MANNQLVQTGVGSTDWTGGYAPPGGTHTGTCTITMLDGTHYVVASSVAEVARKTDLHAVAKNSPAWVAFDVPGAAVPVVLNVNQIVSFK